MTDVVVYTNSDVLRHKRAAGEAFYWEMKRKPRALRRGGRIYFATNGTVRGSFEVDRLDPEGPTWLADSWRASEVTVATKPFRGFRYRWWS